MESYIVNIFAIFSHFMGAIKKSLTTSNGQLYLIQGNEISKPGNPMGMEKFCDLDHVTFLHILYFWFYQLRC